MSNNVLASGPQQCMLASALTMLRYMPRHSSTTGKVPDSWADQRWPMRYWTRFLGEAATAAMTEMLGHSEIGRRAGPLVALACLFLLPPSACDVLESVRLDDARCFLEFLRLAESAAPIRQ